MPITCAECSTEKPMEDFYKSNARRCKECVKRAVRDNRQQNIDYYRAYDRVRYRYNPERQQAAREKSRKHELARRGKQKQTRADMPEKYRARTAVGNALRDGKLIRPDGCFFCGSDDKLQAHHHDYAMPLEVTWLCSKCHGKLHYINGDLRRGDARKEA